MLQIWVFDLESWYPPTLFFNVLASSDRHIIPSEIKNKQISVQAEMLPLPNILIVVDSGLSMTH